MTGELDSDLLATRTAILRRAGASGAALDEVLAYTGNPYRSTASFPLDFPLPDEAHVGVWREYAGEAATIGAFEALRRRFPQLRFPIRRGISSELEYIDATKKGVVRESGSGPGLSLVDPRGLELAVVPTIAGHLPVLVAPAREDFVTLVQAFTERNEPAAVPATMGACIVNGLINWDRVARYKAVWLSERALADEAEWRSTGFPKMAADKTLYQDRLVILSRGSYSALDADRTGLTEAEWLDRSLVIRREHEFTHYCTWRLFGRFRTHAHDELLADFVGLVRAFDRYPPELAFRLLGVADTGPLVDGRLQNYKGSLSNDAFTVVARLSAGATRTLDKIASRMGADLGDLSVLGRVVYALSQLHLEELAARDGLERFERAFKAAGRVTDVGPQLDAPAKSDEGGAFRTGGIGAGGPTAHRRTRVEPRAGTAVDDVSSAFDRLAAGDAEMVALSPDFHLVIDEVISNVERYGEGSGKPPRLWCEFVRRADTVEMIVVDDGPAFDPLQQPEPQLEAALEDRPVGGLGIFLVRRLMSAVRYERRDGRNRLWLTVRFTRAAPGTPTPS